MPKDGKVIPSGSLKPHCSIHIGDGSNTRIVPVSEALPFASVVKDCALPFPPKTLVEIHVCNFVQLRAL